MTRMATTAEFTSLHRTGVSTAVIAFPGHLPAWGWKRKFRIELSAVCLSLWSRWDELDRNFVCLWIFLFAIINRCDLFLFLLFRLLYFMCYLVELYFVWMVFKVRDVGCGLKFTKGCLVICSVLRTLLWYFWSVVCKVHAPCWPSTLNSIVFWPCLLLLFLLSLLILFLLNM